MVRPLNSVDSAGFQLEFGFTPKNPEDLVEAEKVRFHLGKLFQDYKKKRGKFLAILDDPAYSLHQAEFLCQEMYEAFRMWSRARDLAEQAGFAVRRRHPRF